MQLTLMALILVGAVALLVTQALPFEVTALLVIFTLAATGILTPGEALSGLSSEATVTVAAMFILSAGLTRTGSLDYLTRLLDRVRFKSHRWLLVGLGGVVAVPSAFLNNTPVVILLIPVALSLAKKYQLSPSKLMIPVSYFAILGGTLTVIGTSTNILVDNLYRAAGGPGFSMFEFTGMGLCYLLIGGAYIALFAGRLPDRTVLSQLLEPQQRSDFVTEIVVTPDSRLIGATLGEVIGQEKEARIVELVRGEDVQLRPARDTAVAAGDTLLVEGSPRAIHRLLQNQGLDLASAVADDQRVKISRIDLVTVEAVVVPVSPLEGRKLSEIGLNRRYGIKVLAIQRLGRHHRFKLREMKLQIGDVLLIQGENAALHELQDSEGVLLIEGVDKGLTFPAKAPLATAIMAAVVIVAALGWLPISLLAVGGAAALVLTGCLKLREAFRSLESSVLLLLAGTIPLGVAMAKTGLAEIVARSALLLGEYGGPIVLVAALYLATSALTEILSNNATAVLIAPIALEIAAKVGVDPKPLLVAIAFGASASFATPIGYQTNTLVMGPGGYRFSDFTRIGLPLNLLLWVAATILIPLFWPL